MSVEVRQHRNTYQPLGLLAELTHRCPLGCPYCSNPLHLDQRAGELDAATWARVFHEAAALGVLQFICRAVNPEHAAI
jgi:Predicted Fe-S oxidoreductases